MTSLVVKLTPDFNFLTNHLAAILSETLSYFFRNLISPGFPGPGNSNSTTLVVIFYVPSSRFSLNPSSYHTLHGNEIDCNTSHHIPLHCPSFMRKRQTLLHPFFLLLTECSSLNIKLPLDFRSTPVNTLLASNLSS